MHSFCDYTVSETRDCPQSNLLCLQGCSKKVLQNFLGTFKEPLIVAYRRPQNLMSHSHETDILTNSSLKMYLRWNLKHLPATVSSMAQTVTCTKCQLMYIGERRAALNYRFNRYRSWIWCYLNCCKLPGIFIMLTAVLNQTYLYLPQEK